MAGVSCPARSGTPNREFPIVPHKSHLPQKSTCVLGIELGAAPLLNCGFRSLVSLGSELVVLNVRREPFRAAQCRTNAQSRNCPAADSISTVLLCPAQPNTWTAESFVAQSITFAEPGLRCRRAGALGSSGARANVAVLPPRNGTIPGRTAGRGRKNPRSVRPWRRLRWTYCSGARTRRRHKDKRPQTSYRGEHHRPVTAGDRGLYRVEGPRRGHTLPEEVAKMALLSLPLVWADGGYAGTAERDRPELRAPNDRRSARLTIL